MGTLMAWALVQAAEPGPSCQAVSELPAAASASVTPAAGRARTTVRPGGSGGSARQEAPGPARVSPRLPDRTTAVAPPAPKEADATCAPPSRYPGDSCHCWPPSLVQAASRLADGPVP